MDKDKKVGKEEDKMNTSLTEKDNRPRSSAFNEPPPETQKSTLNTEEADLEQERKDAMTERD